MLRSVIADLKQKLETKEVASFVWITDEFMPADILTKEKKSKEGLSGVMNENTLNVVNRNFNVVTEENGEFTMRNIRVKDNSKMELKNEDDEMTKDLLVNLEDSKQRRESRE